jgi:hypothetical protein
MTYDLIGIQNHVLRSEILQAWSYFFQKGDHLFER